MLALDLGSRGQLSSRPGRWAAPGPPAAPAAAPAHPARATSPRGSGCCTSLRVGAARRVGRERDGEARDAETLPSPARSSPGQPRLLRPGSAQPQRAAAARGFQAARAESGGPAPRAGTTMPMVPRAGGGGAAHSRRRSSRHSSQLGCGGHRL